MRSRRGFIGGMVGTTALLAGCAGILEEGDKEATEEGMEVTEVQNAPNSAGGVDVTVTVTNTASEVSSGTVVAEIDEADRSPRTKERSIVLDPDESTSLDFLLDIRGEYPDGEPDYSISARIEE
ncbi:hypothetical protein [Salinarchaeum laminariae]|uniref:hypothetical protein n=1 Tax=Salinarchaeum laminariae TaxID=869888 RepID=UPI0020BE5CA6|nr:hypothetical protein [Salinarchaeum laminariae]